MRRYRDGVDIRDAWIMINNALITAHLMNQKNIFIPLPLGKESKILGAIPFDEFVTKMKKLDYDVFINKTNTSLMIETKVNWIVDNEFTELMDS